MTRQPMLAGILGIQNLKPGPLFFFSEFTLKPLLFQLILLQEGMISASLHFEETDFLPTSTLSLSSPVLVDISNLIQCSMKITEQAAFFNSLPSPFHF